MTPDTDTLESDFAWAWRVLCAEFAPANETAAHSENVAAPEARTDGVDHADAE